MKTSNFLPSSLRRSIIDFNDISYRLANGRLVVYEGNSEAGKHRINLNWDFFENDRGHALAPQKGLIDRLREIWSGPPQKPTLDIMPDVFNFPNEIFRCRWKF